MPVWILKYVFYDEVYESCKIFISSSITPGPIFGTERQSDVSVTHESCKGVCGNSCENKSVLQVNVLAQLWDSLFLYTLALHQVESYADGVLFVFSLSMVPSLIST